MKRTRTINIFYNYIYFIISIFNNIPHLFYELFKYIIDAIFIVRNNHNANWNLRVLYRAEISCFYKNVR